MDKSYLQELRRNVVEYLDTLPDDEIETLVKSPRQFARFEIRGFIDWLECHLTAHAADGATAPTKKHDENEDGLSIGHGALF